MRRWAVALARLLAAGALCWIALRVVSFVRYPFGGGEFHAIFAYPDGTFDDARAVFLTYLATAAAVTAFLVMAGYRAAWWAIAGITSLVCLDSWWQVCTFGYSVPWVRGPAMRLLPVIPIAIATVAYVAHRIRARVLSRRGVAASG
jgi:hypothetical protein